MEADVSGDRTKRRCPQRLPLDIAPRRDLPHVSKVTTQDTPPIRSKTRSSPRINVSSYMSRVHCTTM